MAGKKHYSVDHKITDVTPDGNRNVFVAIYNTLMAMQATGYVTRIALQYGYNNATGMNWAGTPDAAGENAFAVFRFNAAAPSTRTKDFYMLIQWADARSFGLFPGAPATSSKSDSVAIDVAWCDDGSSPWNGTTNNDGTDAKGANVWSSATSTARSALRANGAPTGGTAGVDATTKRRLAAFVDASSAPYDLAIVGDADGLVMWAKHSSYDSIMYAGAYTPVDATNDVPFIVATMPYNMGPGGTSIGSRAGNAAYEGGVSVPGDDSVSCMLMHPMPPSKGNYGKNTINPAAPVTDVWPMAVVAMDSDGATAKGCLGHIDPSMIARCNSGSHGDTTADMRRFVYGTSATTYAVYLLPWDGATVPGTVATTGGVQSIEP